MNKTIQILLAIVFAISLNTQAQEEFPAVNDEGDTIYYFIHYLDNQPCLAVTYSSNQVDPWYDDYRGSITIPDSVLYEGNYYIVKTISSHAFLDCEELTSVSIPNSVVSIGPGAFSHCSALTSVNIPNSVTSICSGTFFGCEALPSITIPSSVTEIDFSAFIHCLGLTSITCSAQIPPQLGLYVFEDVDKSIPLYVPEASVGLYQAAEGWRDFYNIQIGLDDINVANNINVLIYPNPAKDKAKISIDNLNSKADIFIYDIMGKEVKREVIAKETKELELNISDLNRGVYNIRIVNERIDMTKKLIVQ